MIKIITKNQTIEVPYRSFFKEVNGLKLIKENQAIAKGFLKQNNYYLSYQDDCYCMINHPEELYNYGSIQEQFQDILQFKCEVDFDYERKTKLELEEHGKEYLGVLFQDGSYYVSSTAISHKPVMLAYLNECIVNSQFIERAYEHYKLNQEFYYYSCEEDFLIKYLGIIKFGSVVDGKYFIYISNPGLESKEQLKFLKQQKQEICKQNLLHEDCLELLKSKQLIKELKNK